MYEGKKINLVQNLVETKQFLMRIIGPVEFSRRPMKEVAFERFERRQANAAVFPDIGEGSFNGAYHWGMKERRIIVTDLKNVDHVTSPAQTSECAR